MLRERFPGSNTYTNDFTWTSAWWMRKGLASVGYASGSMHDSGCFTTSSISSFHDSLYSLCLPNTHDIRDFLFADWCSQAYPILSLPFHLHISNSFEISHSSNINNTSWVLRKNPVHKHLVSISTHLGVQSQLFCLRCHAYVKVYVAQNWILTPYKSWDSILLFKFILTFILHFYFMAFPLTISHRLGRLYM